MATKPSATSRDDSKALALIEKSRILNPDIKLGEIMKLVKELGSGPDGDPSGKVWFCISPWFFLGGDSPDTTTSTK